MSPSSVAGVTSPSLLGREQELSELTALLRDLERGTGTAVLIEGEPGIGKSTLVSALVAEATAPQALTVTPQVFRGTGDELGQELPLLPFLDALKVRMPGASARRNAIAALLRGEAATDRGADVTAALAEQLLALVTDECAQLPVILVIDDLQWADPASVTLWGRLARLAPQVALLLVGIMRPVPQRDDLLKLRRAQNDATRLELTPLADSAVADLVAVRAGGKPDGPLLRLAGSAAGNPLYVTEIVDALVRSGGLTITESGTAQLAGGVAPTSLPRSLSAAITDRLGFVAGPVREMLRAAALLGVEFAVPDLATVLGKSVTDLFGTVDEARTVGVLTESGSDLAFRHPLIRAALYDEMPVAMRAAWHRDAGRALAQAGAPVDRVARQLLRALGTLSADGLVAGSGGTGVDAVPGAATAVPGALSTQASSALDNLRTPLDDWMVRWLTSAGDLLVGQAPGVASELLAKAVANTPTSSHQYGWLSSRLADALYRVGDRTQAELVADRALGLVNELDPNLLVDLHWTIAQCRMLGGLGLESLAALDRALATPGLSPRHRARLLVLAARTHSNLGEFDKGGRVAAEALTAAEEAGDTWAMGWALHVLAIGATVQGQLAGALPLYDRALAVTQADPALSDLRLLLSINKAATLGNLDRCEEALVAAEQARNFADQVGTTFRATQVRSIYGQLLLETGRWDDALAEIGNLPENLKEPAAACNELGIGAMICFHRSEVVEAHRYLAASVPHARRIGQRLIPPLALARSLDREQAGILSDALAELTAWFDGGTEELGQTEDLVADAVRLAVKVGDLSIARSLAKQAEELAENSQVPHQQANALYCSGLVEHDPHKLLAAADRYHDASRPLLMAKALEAAAEEFVAIDDKGAARDAMGRAVEAYTGLGAQADVNRVQAAFREYGIRRGPHSKHRKATSGWDSLTDAELKIASMVAEGLSNPDIAQRLVTSPRTVGTHVSHILKKLGVASRAEIAREAALRAGK
jgi:DNA-binding CsgD family transcriptional regulator/tetratricopeptide (TPR) repeat protein